MLYYGLTGNVSISGSTTISNLYAQRHKAMPAHITRWYNRLGPKTDDGRTYDDDYVNRTKKLENMNDMEYREGLPSNAMYYHIEKSGSSSVRFR